MSLDVMKQALHTLEGWANHGEWVWPESALEQAKRNTTESITVLRAAIDQAQEPVAWMYHGIRHDDTPHERPSLIWKPEYMDVMSAEKGAKATPLYTAPRQWQGLTEQEIKDCEKQAMVNGALPFEQRSFFARAIEAKLKEKNS